METPFLIEFLSEAYELEYSERPNYGKFRFNLIKELLDEHLSPERFYSWSNTMPKI